MYISCANDREKKWREIEKLEKMKKTKFVWRKKIGSSNLKGAPIGEKEKVFSVAM
mgnify:CR=1 FL=1